MTGELSTSESKSRISRKIVVPALACLAFISACGERSESSSAATAAPTAASSSANTNVQFRFDNLGSTYPGAETIFTYPGPLDTPADKQHNGTFNNKEIVDAICIARGRWLSPDPAYNESPRPEQVQDQWVKINGSPGETQYASLTYGQLIPPDAQLPPCPDVQ